MLTLHSVFLQLTPTEPSTDPTPETSLHWIPLTALFPSPTSVIGPCPGPLWSTVTVDAASRLAASRSYTASDELARLRRDAPQTQIGEGANDALLFALAKGRL